MKKRNNQTTEAQIVLIQDLAIFELVEFQATINMPTDDAANHSCNNESSNIVIMEDTEQLNGKSVTGHHRVVKDLASLLDRGN